MVDLFGIGQQRIFSSADLEPELLMPAELSEAEASRVHEPELA